MAKLAKSPVGYCISNVKKGFAEMKKVGQGQSASFQKRGRIVTNPGGDPASMTQGPQVDLSSNPTKLSSSPDKDCLRTQPTNFCWRD